MTDQPTDPTQAAIDALRQVAGARPPAQQDHPLVAKNAELEEQLRVLDEVFCAARANVTTQHARNCATLSAQGIHVRPLPQIDLRAFAQQTARQPGRYGDPAHVGLLRRLWTLFF